MIYVVCGAKGTVIDSHILQTVTVCSATDKKLVMCVHVVLIRFFKRMHFTRSSGWELFWNISHITLLLNLLLQYVTVSASYICVNFSFILTVVVNIVMYCYNHDKSYINCTLQQALLHDFFFFYVLLTMHLKIIRSRKTNLIHNLFFVYFVNLYMFWAYLGPIIRRYCTTVCIQHLVLILFRWLSVVLDNRQSSKKNVVYIRLYLLMMGLDTPKTYTGWWNILRIRCASSWFFCTPPSFMNLLINLITILVTLMHYSEVPSLFPVMPVSAVQGNLEEVSSGHLTT